MTEIKIGDQVMRGEVIHFSIFDETDNAPFVEHARKAMHLLGELKLSAWGKELAEYRKWENFLNHWAAMQTPRIIFTNSIDAGKNK